MRSVLKSVLRSSLLESVLKKGTLVGVSTALAVTGLAAGAGTAHADGGGPLGSSNIRGTQRGDADLMLERLCSQEPYRDGHHYGALNIKTGEFMDWKQMERAGNELPAPNWDFVAGTCTYPESSTWSVKGKTIRTSNWIGNGGTSEDKETFVRRYTTTTTYKKSVGAEAGFSFAKSIFSASAGGSIDYEWGWEKESAFERRSEKSIPACSQIAMTWTPYQRVVRVNPVFHVTGYSWVGQDGQVKSADNWRGWGDDWKSIYSHGYYIDGISDKLLPDGSPDGREDKVQESLDPSRCA